MEQRFLLYRVNVNGAGLGIGQTIIKPIVIEFITADASTLIQHLAFLRAGQAFHYSVIKFLVICNLSACVFGRLGRKYPALGHQRHGGAAGC